MRHMATPTLSSREPPNTSETSTAALRRAQRGGSVVPRRHAVGWCRLQRHADVMLTSSHPCSRWSHFLRARRRSAATMSVLAPAAPSPAGAAPSSPISAGAGRCNGVASGKATGTSRQASTAHRTQSAARTRAGACHVRRLAALSCHRRQNSARPLQVLLSNLRCVCVCVCAGAALLSVYLARPRPRGVSSPVGPRVQRSPAASLGCPGWSCAAPDHPPLTPGALWRQQ